MSIDITALDATRNEAIAASNRDRYTSGDPELGQEDFFSLIVAQMTNQNPLEPMKDTDFIAQMAHFGTLEQMTNLNSSEDKSRALSYLGQDVSLNLANGERSQGHVDAVHMGSDGPELEVNGKRYDLESISTIRQLEATPSAT